MSPRRVMAGTLVCLAAGGCATASQPRETETMSDCPRLAAAPATPRPTAERDGSGPNAAPLAGPRFRLLDTTLDKSQLADPQALEESAPDRPLDTTDSRAHAYFEEIKRRIRVVWAFPENAARQARSGSGAVVIRVTKEGRLGTVDVVQSTGWADLDRHMVTSIRAAAPFPPLPCRIAEGSIPINLRFSYVLKAPPEPTLPAEDP